MLLWLLLLALGYPVLLIVLGTAWITYGPQPPPYVPEDPEVRRKRIENAPENTIIC